MKESVGVTEWDLARAYSLFALAVAGEGDMCELGWIQSCGFGRYGLSLGALRFIGHRCGRTGS